MKYWSRTWYPGLAVTQNKFTMAPHNLSYLIEFHQRNGFSNASSEQNSSCCAFRESDRQPLPGNEYTTYNIIVLCHTNIMNWL